MDTQRMKQILAELMEHLNEMDGEELKGAMKPKEEPQAISVEIEKGPMEEIDPEGAMDVKAESDEMSEEELDELAKLGM